MSYHNTLNEALAASNTVDLIALWPLGSNIQYGQTVQHIVQNGRELRLISVYRNEKGMYESAISYRTN